MIVPYGTVDADASNWVLWNSGPGVTDSAASGAWSGPKAISIASWTLAELFSLSSAWPDDVLNTATPLAVPPNGR